MAGFVPWFHIYGNILYVYGVFIALPAECLACCLDSFGEGPPEQKTLVKYNLSCNNATTFFFPDSNKD